MNLPNLTSKYRAALRSYPNIRLGFLRVVFSGEEGSIGPPPHPFIFQEELI